MSISGHLGIVILVIVGAVTVLGLIIAAIIETGRMDKAKPSIPQQTSETPADKKKG
jgi:ABC-type enterochelin transport system permease subunit